MNSLFEFLSSPLLDFIPINSPSNNIEQPGEIDILLETLYLKAIFSSVLDRRVIDDLGDDEHQQDQGITVANASDISYHRTCSGNTTITTPLR